MSNVPTANALPETSYTGDVYTKDSSGNYTSVEKIMVNYLKADNKNISAVSEINEFSFSGTISNIDSVVNTYQGHASYHGIEYDATMVATDTGVSVLFYDLDLDFIRTAVLSKSRTAVDECINTVNSDVVPQFENNSIIQERSTEETNTTDFLESSSVRSGNPVTKTLHISKDGKVIPFVVSSGAVDGTLTYTKGLDPTQQFCADKLEGFVAWETRFCGISITNVNEMYGTLWGTPNCPARTNQTWYIGKGAEYSGTYYLKATVSYTALIDLIPLLGWFSDQKVIN